jgi:hypothetical protein
MATITERLYQAALLAVKGIPGVLEVHDRKRVAVFARDEMPCIRVLEGDDTLIDPMGDAEDLRELTLKFEIYLHGEPQQDQVDDIRQGIVSGVWANTDIARISGWITTDDRPEPERKEGDGLQVRVTQRMRFRYPCDRRNLARAV